MNVNFSRNHFNCYCFVLLIVCNAVLAVVSGTTNGRKNDRNTGGRWYDKTKWSNAARNPPVVEGSGNSDIVSDLDETPRGLGPDDEDSETGSGAMESPGSVEEGSGLGGIKFESSTGGTFDATHSTTRNATSKLISEPGADTKLTASDSVTEAALFVTSTLAQRPVTQQEPVHSTHNVPGYPIGSKEDADADDEEDEDEDDEDDEEDDEEDLYSFGAHSSSSATPFIPPIVVDAGPQQPLFTVTQPSTTATTAVKPPIPIDPTLTAVTAPSPGVATTPSTAARPLPTDDDMYDRTPDKRNDRHGFQWIFSTGVLTAVIGGAVVGLLAAILLVMFVVYRMRKKDEGSYVLDEPKAPPTYPYAYHKAPAREFYA